ncbi:MAG TPA: EsaB/YukD family protein [Candidatus Dormibacteraeota bacterium]|nr:EsaB/YukD family protein [Candidatus Dormibacteraeota bacterium]
MAADVRHVTVHGAGRRLDLTLPATVPILELTPALARLCGATGDEGTPPAWTLARVGAEPLPLTGSLADAAVIDGEVLHLVDAAVWRTPVVSDDRADDRPGEGLASHRWTPALRATLLAALAALQITAAAGLVVWTGTPSRAGSLGLLLVAGVQLGIAHLRRSQPARAPIASLVVGAWVFAGVGAWGVLGGERDAGGVADAAVGLLIAAAFVGPILPELAPGAIAAFLGLCAGAAAVAHGASPPRAAAVLGVMAVVALRLLPAVGGHLDAGDGPEGPRSFRRRLALSALSGGTTLVALGAVLVLIIAGQDVLALALAGAITAALLLRAHSGQLLLDALPAALAGGLALTALLTGIGTRVLVPLGHPLVAVGLLAASGFAAAVLSFAARPLPIGSRLLAMAWLAVDASTVPLALGELGAFDAMLHLGHTFFG